MDTDEQDNMDQENTYQLTVDRMAATGEGIGRLPDGRTVFIPFTLPGEVVTCHLTQQKKNFARAEMIELIEASPKRISPRCKHFGVCGGCQLQHLSYADQLDVKKNTLLDLLTRIGKQSEVPRNHRDPIP